MRRVGKTRLFSILLFVLLAVGLIAASGMAVYASEEEETVTIYLDLNGATPTVDWRSNEEKLTPSEAAELTTLPIPSKEMMYDTVYDPPENCEFAGLEITHKGGEETVVGKPGETVTGLDFTRGGNVKWLWEEKYYTLTLHVSTLEGEDQLAPIVIDNVGAGTPFDEALQLLDPEYTPSTSLFSLEGYVDACQYRSFEPIAGYNKYEDERENKEAFEESGISGGQEILGDYDIYYCLTKPVRQVGVTVEAPRCGVETTTPLDEEKSPDYDRQTNPPTVTSTGEGYYISYTGWIRSPEELYIPFMGTFEGGKEYYLDMELVTRLGYSWDLTEADYAAKGAEVEMAEAGEKFTYLMLRTTAEHDWGEWTVTKAATESEEGIESRFCAGDPAHTETRAIPKIDPANSPVPPEKTPEKEEENKNADNGGKESGNTNKSEAEQTTTPSPSPSPSPSPTNRATYTGNATSAVSAPKTADTSNAKEYMVLFGSSAAMLLLHLSGKSRRRSF